MALRDETTARIHNASTTVGEIVAINGLPSFALFTKTQCLVCYELVGAKAVVKFDYIHLVGCYSCLPVSILSCKLGH